MTAFPNPVKTVLRIAAIHISFEADALGIETALMSVPGSASFIHTYKHSVMVLFSTVLGSFAALIQELCLGKVTDHFTVDEPGFCLLYTSIAPAIAQK